MADAERSEELKELFWKELKGSPFVMIGLQGVEDSRTRPWTAQVNWQDEDELKHGGDIYFFGAKSEAIVKGLAENNRVVCTYASKGHGLFASIHGTLSLVEDRALIEKFWNPIIASWYKGGKDDPDLALLRLDTSKAEIWKAEAGSTLVAAALKLLGRDPGKDHEHKNQAEVAL
ncbi:pyridoxamine 5'-phosphate oxidase family protein [Sphingomonas astaxanthinifaciens]|uniref:General stress protein n=1 Tax=Sphingomonas astaxanthinifaciens DSM 22298 TaxID=1123267 RepID=A0ABQ5ZBI9_9SPHN|nr:pyridoxamine 5'-phosphate oxidase family protein [Sphingomonas astaxanthinifaciens]GLR47962.1 general stress protein [Sphingomonas astaxanthinifaciens DSM 22298]